MIIQDVLNDEEIRQRKNRFWISWVILNILGTSLGWFFGQYLGQIVYHSYGEKAGILTAAVLFEFFVWFGRLVPSRYFTRQSALKFLDILIWATTEIGGWIMFEFFTSGTPDNFLSIQAAFIYGMGVSMWILFASIGLLKTEREKNPKNWMPKAFIYGLVGYLAGSVIVSLIATTSMVAGEYIEKIFSSYLGWAISGAILGGGFAIITGYILTKSILWTEDIEFQSTYRNS
jgi:hypothetical protein